MSEHITEIEPRASIDFNSFTIAFSLASFSVSSDKTIVIIGFNYSGIAATAKATANNNESRTVFP